MQFVNIIVHSVEDMNYRVHLQYEFTKLGLDDYLEKLRHTESEDLQVLYPSMPYLNFGRKIRNLVVVGINKIKTIRHFNCNIKQLVV